MRRILFALTLLLSFTAVQAQDKAALVDFQKLTYLVMPDYDARYAKFQTYQDSVIKEVARDPRFKELESQALKSTSSNEDEAKAGREAMKQMETIKSNLSQKLGRDYDQQFKSIGTITNTIRNVLLEQNYTLAFLYNDDGFQDYLFASAQMQMGIESQVNRCFETLNIENPNADRNQAMTACRQQVLGPLYEAAVDITELVQEQLGK